MRHESENLGPLVAKCLEYLENDAPDAVLRELSGHGEAILPPLVNALNIKRREARNHILVLGYDTSVFDDDLDSEARDLMQPYAQSSAQLVNKVANRVWNNLFAVGRRYNGLNDAISNLFDGDKEKVWASSLIFSEAALAGRNEPKHKQACVLSGLGHARRYAENLRFSEKSRQEGTVLGLEIEVARQFIGSKAAENALRDLAKEVKVDLEILEETAVTRAYGFYVRML